jgi:hypothetical protein
MRNFGEKYFPKNLFRINYFGISIIAWIGNFCMTFSSENAEHSAISASVKIRQ